MQDDIGGRLVQRRNHIGDCLGAGASLNSGTLNKVTDGGQVLQFGGDAHASRFIHGASQAG